MAINKVIYGTTVLVDLTGDTVAAENLLKGIKAHGADGSEIVGTLEVSQGSNDNNCEAYIVDASNPVVNFKTVSGTIKAWGYGKGTTSGYTTPQYGFMGTTYTSISSWGGGSTTNLSLSVDSSGNISGLPTMTSGTLLITRGV